MTPQDFAAYEHPLDGDGRDWPARAAAEAAWRHPCRSGRQRLAAAVAAQPALDAQPGAPAAEDGCGHWCAATTACCAASSTISRTTGSRSSVRRPSPPSLLAAEGVMTTARPSRADWRDIAAGVEAARAIGRLDIGQAAVAIGGRVVALEGIEGTDGLLRARARPARSRPHRRSPGAACWSSA